jgi:hypothetical protein
VRQYQYLATDATIDALRRLRGAWAGYHHSATALVVALADGGAVRIHVEGAGVEPDFEAHRLSAAPADAPAEPLTPAGAFGAGRNDLVVCRSETWIEGPGTSADDGAGPSAVVQFTGSALQRSDTAAATCAVDDALVVATSAGTGMLIRCGLQPYALDVTTDSATIARFLTERQYGDG